MVSWCASELGCDSAEGLQDVLPDTPKADLNRGDTGLMRSGLVLHAAGYSVRLAGADGGVPPAQFRRVVSIVRNPASIATREGRHFFTIRVRKKRFVVLPE